MNADPEIEARMARRAFALREAVTLLLTVTNPGAPEIVVPEPMVGDRALRVRLTPPRGPARAFDLSEVPRDLGVPRPNVGTSVLAGERVTFSLDLAALTPIDEPGRYSLALDYEWGPGSTWRSPDLAFEILAPSGTFVEVVPNDAAGVGRQAILWAERDEGVARALLLDAPRGLGEVKGADGIADMPEGAEPALSTAPAELATPERWIAWVSGASVHYRFYAFGGGADLPTQSATIAARGAIRIVRPLLAEHAPDADRPGCTIGIVAADGSGPAEFVRVEIDASGAARALPPVPLPSASPLAWATSPSAAHRAFVFAFIEGGAAWIAGLMIASGVAGGVVRWASVPCDALLAGDVRATAAGEIRVGLLLDRAGAWVRAVWTITGAGVAREVISAAAEVPRGATPARVRLDERGDLHVLARSGDELGYLAPGAVRAERCSARARPGPFAADFFLARGERPRAIVYDEARGPTAVDL